MGSTKDLMTDKSVCAVIVSYHPTASMTANLTKVLAQVQGLVVVDNGSNPEALSYLRAASQTCEFHLIENQENLGIAEALNRGVRWAQSRGFPWVILFDQDSRITDGFIDQMFSSWEAHPSRERIGSMHPRYVDPDTGLEPTVVRADDGGPVSSMTSGALMSTSIFEKIGFFETNYFIDQVDTEYCFRIRAAGYTVADSRETVLLHAPGYPKRQKFLGFSFEPTHHSALRRYYLSRNRVVVYKKYFHIFPRLVTYAIYIASRETIKCLLAEKNRTQKVRSVLLGTWDGLTGKMGKREGL